MKVNSFAHGDRELLFDHADTNYWFVLTRHSLIFYLNIVTSFLIYKRLGKTSVGKIISIPWLGAGHHTAIRYFAERIDSEFQKGGCLSHAYGFVVKGNKSRLFILSLEELQKKGYPINSYSEIIAPLIDILNP